MRLPGHGHPLPDGIDGPLQRDPSRLLVSPQAGQKPCLHQRPLASPHVRERGECTGHSDASAILYSLQKEILDLYSTICVMLNDLSQ